MEEFCALSEAKGMKNHEKIRSLSIEVHCRKTYKRSPFMSLMRDRIILQLQLTTPGNVSMTVCRKVSISSEEAATA